MKKKKTVKGVKMHNCLVFACKSQDFAQSQKFCARSHDRETVSFRNSVAPVVVSSPPGSGFSAMAHRDRQTTDKHRNLETE